MATAEHGCCFYLSILVWILMHCMFGVIVLLDNLPTTKPQLLNVSNCLFPLSETLLRNGRYMAVEDKARWGRPRKISDRMARDLVRKSQKNPHITVKQLGGKRKKKKKAVADTGQTVHRTTMQRS